MAREHQLCVIRAGRAERVSFTGAPLLSEILLENGFPVRRPCGGRGVCRKCALRAEGGIDGLPDDAGRVLAASAVSCPPCVPIAVCGERIDETAAALLRYYGIGRIAVVRGCYSEGTH